MRADTLIAVTTTARNGADYFPQVIAALNANGAREVGQRYRLVHSDGRLRFHPPGWNVIETNDRIGSRLSFWNVLRIADEMKVDYLLAFEDDISMCRNAVTAMLNYEVPPMLAWVTFFDNMTEDPHAPGLKICSLTHQPFWGAQAVKIPSRCFPYLLGPPAVNYEEALEGYMGGRDLAMQMQMQRSPWPMFGSLFPNLVQHIGSNISVLNGPRALKYKAEGKERISYNYPGDHFDALTLQP